MVLDIERDIERDDDAVPATLLRFASQVLDECGGDHVEAITAMRGRIESDKVLRERIWDPFMDDVLGMVLQRVERQRRNTILRRDRPAPNPDRGAAGLHLVGEMHARTLLDMPLRAGLKLRDAVNADLLAAAEFRLKQGATSLADGYWLRGLGEELPEGVTVEERYDAATLQKLRDKIHQELLDRLGDQPAADSQ